MPKTSRFLVLKCTASDAPDERFLPGDSNTGDGNPKDLALKPAITDLDTYIDDFLGIRGTGTGNLIDYYWDVTYGAVLLETDIRGWFPAPFPSHPTLARNDAIQQCTNAALQSLGNDFDFSGYYGIIAIVNVPYTGGAWGYGPQQLTATFPDGHTQDLNVGMVVFDPYSLWTAFAAHETGHALGLQHSNSTPPCSNGYCDQFDLMSSLNTWQFGWGNYPPELAEASLSAGLGSGGAGPGLNLPNLLTLGTPVLPAVYRYQVGDPAATVVLSALSHPALADVNPISNAVFLGVEVLPRDRGLQDFYTVEYRQADGWDQGFPLNAVMIHEYTPGASPYSFIQDGPTVPPGGTNGGWTAGTVYVNRDKGFVIGVNKIDPSSAVATVTLASFSD